MSGAESTATVTEEPRRFRCGDAVHHHPTGEDWIVAFADYGTGELAWCGWPEGLARIDDCTLVVAASEAMHADMVAHVVGAGGMRGSRARRLYGAGAFAGQPLAAAS